MKKRWISLLALSMLLLTGCRGTGMAPSVSVDDRDSKIVEVYNAYKANGGTLDYETWLSTIKGDKGDKGSDGNRFYTGKGEPKDDAEFDVKEGDMYLDSLTYNLYQFNEKDTWVLIGNIKGESGNKGDKGGKGDKGDKGDSGSAGLSAYELYKKSHPEYIGTEKQWLDDLVNGRLADKRKFKTIFYVDGEVYDTNEVLDGDYLVFPTEPTTQGMKFAGWYLDTNYNSKVPDYYKVTQDTYLYAGFLANRYSLTLHADSFTKDMTYVYGSSLSVIPTPVKNGYDFAGWYMDADFKTKLEDYTFGNDDLDLDLYARFTMHSYNVAFKGIEEYHLDESVIRVDVENPTFRLPSFETDDKAIVAWRIGNQEFSPNEEFSYVDYFGNMDWRDLTFTPVYGTYGLPSDYEIEKGDYGRYVLTKYIGSGKQVIIPDYIKTSDNTYHLVSVIGSDAFKDTEVSSIVLSDSIKVLKEEAFAYAKNITEITIPDTVTAVENNIFMGCESLTHVIYQTTAYPSVGTIFKVPSLKKVTFDTYSTPYEGCSGCTNLEEVELTDKVVKILGRCFNDCTNLKKVNFPDSLTDLGFYSFYGAGIESAIIPETITAIDETFRECFALKFVVLPVSLRSIKSQSFYGTGGYKTFYRGTKDQWDSISIDALSSSVGNDVYYYSDTQPAEEGKYWHYVDGEPTIWETKKVEE